MARKKEIFQQIIADFIERPIQGILSRKIEIPVDAPKIISLLGPRRSGKSSMLFYLVQQLRKEIPSDRLVYVNFEDDRLFPLQLEDLDELIKGYYEMYPANKDHKVYFFLDEVQETNNWEKFIRRIFDQENCRIFITGSSSKMLSREIATSLRGRTLSFEVFPLSFAEFLAFHQVNVSPRSSKGQALIYNMLRKYMKQGGFPELVFLEERFHNKLIQEYIDLMLYRDLTERFSLKNPHLVKYLLKYLLGNMGKLLSVNKIFNDIKSQGYKAGKNTVYDYISYLEEAFIIFRVDRWSNSIRQQAVNPSKIYGIDSAFKYAMSMQEDTGRVFENFIYLELRRQGIQPYYYLDKQEVDFYIPEMERLINVCYDMSAMQTREREVKGLLDAMEALHISEAEIISWDMREDIEIDGKLIRLRSIQDFTLL